MGIASEILDLVKLIAQWVKEGVSDEEIAERLADPTNVGSELLEKAEARRKAGEDYLGRDPE